MKKGRFCGMEFFCKQTGKMKRFKSREVSVKMTKNDAFNYLGNEVKIGDRGLSSSTRRALATHCERPGFKPRPGHTC